MPAGAEIELDYNASQRTWRGELSGDLRPNKAYSAYIEEREDVYFDKSPEKPMDQDDGVRVGCRVVYADRIPLPGLDP